VRIGGCADWWMCGLVDVRIGGCADLRIYLGIIEVGFAVAVEKGKFVTNGKQLYYQNSKQKKGPKNPFDWNFRPVFVELQGFEPWSRQSIEELSTRLVYR